ncbi:MAG: nucleotide exchange factor GrpE [Candidatus Pacebacteria bacterium]|nr:nucleotide exchange factor GrpE [Candidatus Paceibacterota bacterium]
MSTEASDQSQRHNPVNDSNSTPSPDHGAADEALAAAEQRIAELEAEAALEKDQLIRQIAELQNSLRLSHRDREDEKKKNIKKFAEDVITVADNLRRALESVPPEKVSDGQLKNLLEGVAATEKDLMAIFDRWNIKQFSPLGETLDPHLHHAMLELNDTGQKPLTVVQVLIPGYKINDQLLRAAGVAVAKGEIKKVDTKA